MFANSRQETCEKLQQEHVLFVEDFDDIRCYQQFHQCVVGIGIILGFVSFH